MAARFTRKGKEADPELEAGSILPRQQSTSSASHAFGWRHDPQGRCNAYGRIGVIWNRDGCNGRHVLMRPLVLVDVLARRFRPAPFVGWPRQSVLVWFARACGVMIKQSLMVGSFVLLLAISWTSSSLARVECKGDFQVTKYGLIATPWCEEENIAVVARSYGWTVTGSEVRKNPLKKVYICQVLGRDIRLKGSCAGYSPDAYAPGR